MYRIVFLLSFSIFIQKLSSQNNALNFLNNGFVNNTVNLSYHPDLDFDINDKFTIEAWVKTTSDGVIFSNKLNNQSGKGYELAIRNGVLTFEFTRDFLSSKLEVRQLLSCDDGFWNHLAVVYNGTPGASTVKLYYHGLSLTTNGISNSLSGSTSNNNAPFIGTGGYPNPSFFNGSLDEIRVWKRALCSTEINANKDCKLTGTEDGLVAYYQFNQGVASSNNSAITTLIDAGPNNLNGTLSGFLLNGTLSNWVVSTNSVSGVCNPFVFTPTVSGNSIACKDDLSFLSASGAQSYTWMPGTIYGSQVYVNPTVTTTYTITAANSNNCIGLTYHTLIVDECAGLNNNNDKRMKLELAPNPFNNHFTVRGIERNSTLKVYNSLGEIVYTKQCLDELIEVNLHNLAKGFYIVECSLNGYSKKKVLIKQ